MNKTKRVTEIIFLSKNVIFLYILKETQTLSMHIKANHTNIALLLQEVRQ